MSNTNTIDLETDLFNMYTNDDSSKRGSMITNNLRHSLLTTDTDDNTGSEILDTYSQMVRRDISDDEDEEREVDSVNYSDSDNELGVINSVDENDDERIGELGKLRNDVFLIDEEDGDGEKKDVEKDDDYKIEKVVNNENTSIETKEKIGSLGVEENASVDAEDARSGFIYRSASPSKTVNDPEYSDTDSDTEEDDADFYLANDSGFDVPDLNEDEESKNEAIYDDNGNVIDLPQKQRVVSTYSEVGSTWNAFPNMGNNDDVQTVITDVKTIYDNNTLMNVPVRNQAALPPLPKIETLDISNLNLPPLPEQVTPREEEEDKYNLHNDSSDVNSKAITEGKNTLPSTIGTGKQKVPDLSIIKLIRDNKVTHEQKLKELKNYSKQLAEYDSGVFDWINNTLKSNSELKLKENYVMNKHVKEAYSNAEQLSKRNNNHIVSDLNQNMQQLTKKVFTSSMRGKSKSFLKSLRDKTTT
ncbi:hypothetical protein HANVADRAFT_77796 [Hanseniaspora valbyensis NRRL Y-1626]|uniref:Protein FYV8 n=1 Tax=Hanseniaspora valbyensis NRRL Y-1626 TaxID=766949 RepID=A0A1B7TCU0_9ASCO|nr:hypothetical protein HANVADRAFT_77796 [Hanseniaspora valbyensis NRRL Y-1626]